MWKLLELHLPEDLKSLPKHSITLYLNIQTLGPQSEISVYSPVLGHGLNQIRGVRLEGKLILLFMS